MQEARPKVHTEQQRPFIGIHAVKVFVRNHDESLRFYVDKLGFHLAFDARLQSGERWVAVAPSDGTAVLSLIQPAPESREYELIGRPTGIVLVAEDVISKYQEWCRRGVRFAFTPRLRRLKFERPVQAAHSTTPPAPRQSQLWGGVFTVFKDPDGNSFSLIGVDEVNQEIEAQRKRIADKLEAERRTAQELEIARQVQARLFPQRLPPISTLEYAGACIQAHEVGGDYHDFLDLGRDRYAFVIADISGKGIAGALLMANLQASLRSQCAIALEEPERLLRCVNTLFYENTNESAYATLVFADYDDRTGALRYSNCGHPAALLIRHNTSVERLAPTCTVMGLFKEWDCSMAQTRLCSGDTLVLYSDGITESFNETGEEFGEQRLIQTLHRHRELPAEAMIESIVAEVQEFSAEEQSDDITVIVAKCSK